MATANFEQPLLHTGGQLERLHVFPHRFNSLLFELQELGQLFILCFDKCFYVVRFVVRRGCQLHGRTVTQILGFLSQGTQQGPLTFDLLPCNFPFLLLFIELQQSLPLCLQLSNFCFLLFFDLSNYIIVLF